MYLIQRSIRSNGTPFGDVIELSTVSRAIELIPKFGGVVDPSITAEDSMDRFKWYYINSFSDKEGYKAVY